MKNRNENKFLLSEERLSELAGELVVIAETIQMQNHVINFIPTARASQESLLLYYDSVYKALDTFYDMNQKNMKVLDKISFVLQNLSDEKELTSLGETITRSFEDEEGDC